MRLLRSQASDGQTDEQNGETSLYFVDHIIYLIYKNYEPILFKKFISLEKYKNKHIEFQFR